MNAARVADLLRQLADAIDADAPATPAPAPPPAPRQRRPRVHPGPVNPDRAPTDIDAARAARMLRRRGIAS
jgi:hypothetical protein